MIRGPEPGTMHEQGRVKVRPHIPDFYSKYKEKGKGYAAFLGSSIIAKVSPCTDDLFLTMAALCFHFQGDLPRASEQKLRGQGRVRGERTVGDYWDVSDIAVIFSRCDLRPLTPARNGTRIVTLMLCLSN